jgi:hypothetical protein
MEGSIQKAPDPSNDYVLRTSGLLNISFPENTIVSEEDSKIDLSDSKKISDYLFNAGNPGIGVDLGFRYQVLPDLSVSLSVIDFGKIWWKTKLNSRSLDKDYRFEDGTTFAIDTVEGVPRITKISNYTYSDQFDFSRLDRDSASFSKPLPTTIYTGIKYQLSPSISLSLHDRLILLKDLNYNSFSVAATLKVNEKLSISSGYSAIGGSYLNFPLAFLYQGDFGQIYLGTDNLASVVPLSEDDFAGISFGACFYLFAKRNLDLKGSDLLPFYKPRKVIRNRKSGILMKANSEE